MLWFQLLALLFLLALFSERLPFGGGKMIVESKSLYPLRSKACGKQYFYKKCGQNLTGVCWVTCPSLKQPLF